MTSKKIVAFFGCALDPDERDEAILEKRLLSEGDATTGAPYTEIMTLLRRELNSEGWIDMGILEVPLWLSPLPPEDAKKDIKLENFVSFIDQNGCWDFAKAVGDFATGGIFPDIPCMIGIDHSLSGGLLAAAVSYYHPESISYIVLDSHIDSLPTCVMAEAVEYDIRTNPNSVHNPFDPFLKNRPDSYNAGSFIFYLLTENIIVPDNLFLLGVSDYPPRSAFRLKDKRIQRYVSFYSSLKEAGVNILTKKELLHGTSCLRRVLERVKTKYVHISIDMDIGARNALTGVRFQNYRGISEIQIYKIAKCLRELLDQGKQLVGLDLMEFNPRRVAHVPSGVEDSTYRIACNLIKAILFEQ
ncbi:MAG: arginase family protein [Desulfomonilaceae bacterium]